MHLFLQAGGNIIQVPETRPEWNQWQFHYDFRFPIGTRTDRSRCRWFTDFIVTAVRYQATTSAACKPTLNAGLRPETIGIGVFAAKSAHWPEMKRSARHVDARW